MIKKYWLGLLLITLIDKRIRKIRRNSETVVLGKDFIHLWVVYCAFIR